MLLFENYPKTARFILQCIRYSVEKAGRGDLLGNIVEADETYVGGKKRWYARPRCERQNAGYWQFVRDQTYRINDPAFTGWRWYFWW